MTKNALLIPGYGKTPYEDYPATGFELSSAGFAVHGVAPHWGEPFNTLVEQVSSEVEGHLNRDTVALGHGAGGNLLLAALQTLGERGREAGGLVLASPGILCREGLAYENGRKMIGKYFPRQLSDVSYFSIFGVAVDVGIAPERAAVLIGEKEAAQYPHRADLATIVATAFNVRITVVPEAEQFIEDTTEYVQAVSAAAQRVYEAAQI